MRNTRTPLALPTRSSSPRTLPWWVRQSSSSCPPKSWLLINLQQIDCQTRRSSQQSMSQATPKEISKNSIIIIPNSHSLPPSNEVLPPGVEENPEKAIAFYIAEINSLYEMNEQLEAQLRTALEEKKELADAIASFEVIDRSENEDKKKRVRRCANQIERKYVCPIEQCRKSYGTDSSMAQHLRLKHPQCDYVVHNGRIVTKRDAEERPYHIPRQQEDD